MAACNDRLTMLLSLGQPPWIPGAVVIPPSPTAGQCEAPNIGPAAGEAGSCGARARELGRFVMLLPPVNNAVHPLGKLICLGILPTLYPIVGRVLVDRVLRLLSRRSALLRSCTVMASVGIFRRHTTSSGMYKLKGKDHWEWNKYSRNCSHLILRPSSSACRIFSHCKNMTNKSLGIFPKSSLPTRIGKNQASKISGSGPRS